MIFLMRHSHSVFLPQLLLCFFLLLQTAQAATLSQGFELTITNGANTAPATDVPFQVNETGPIRVHITFTAADRNFDQALTAVLMQDDVLGQRASTRVNQGQSAQLHFVAEPIHLKHTRRFLVRLSHPAMQSGTSGKVYGRVSVEYPDEPKELPDLVITNTRTDNKCHLIVTVSNHGKGMLELAPWEDRINVNLVIERNNKAWAAINLKTLDPMQQLVHPGGQIEYRTKLVAPAQRPENIALVIDRKNQIRESNEQNNRQNMALSCTPQG